MLEGKEVQGKIGDIGTYEIDIDAKGAVKFSVSINKDFGFGKLSSTNSMDTNVFTIAEEIAKKTKTTWDDKAIAGIKKILGIE